MLKDDANLTTMADVPVVDLAGYMDKELTEEVQEVCRQVANSFHHYGILIIKDPRADFQANSDYIDMMEKYFKSRGEKLYAGEALDDAKPDYHYQVGICPENLEIARDHSERMKKYSPENKPVSPIVPIFDAKWRFMWKIGERPAGATDNFPQVIPEDFPEWETRMDTWGNTLLNAVHQAAEMAAIGMGVEKSTFAKHLEGGAHLLAPTGSDLEKNDVGTIFAGFHYDISFMTIHGKSRYPGLYVWLRNGQKLQVKVPDGCLLIQAGKTFEHITGGYVLAGLHEVIYTDTTKDKFEEAKAAQRSTWRVSSTMFNHFKFDTDCQPMENLSHLYQKETALAKYGQKTAFEILMEELNATNMVSDDSQFFNPEARDKDQLAI